MQDFAQGLTRAHPVAGVIEAAVDAGGVGVHGHQAALRHDAAGLRLVEVHVQQKPLGAEEAQHGLDALPGGLLVDGIGGGGVDGEGLRLPDLPVVVEGGGVVGPGVAHQHVGQAEAAAQRGALQAQIHHLHVGQEVAGHVEGGELDAEPIGTDLLEELGGDALGGLALKVAGEHAVDVGVVQRPEALADVHGEVVDGGHHQDLPAGGELSLLLQPGEPAHQLGGDVHLLHLVAAQRAHDAGGLFALAEAEARDAQVVAVEGLQAEQNFALHAWASSLDSTRAISEPSYTSGYSRRVKSTPSQGDLTSTPSPVRGLMRSPMT